MKRDTKEKHRLPSLSLVFGFIAIKELGRLEDQVRVLARLGYGNAEIAKICGTTIGSVRTLKSQSKRRGEHKRKQKT